MTRHKTTTRQRKRGDTMRDVAKAMREAAKLPQANYTALTFSEFDAIRQAANGDLFKAIGAAFDVGITTGYRLATRQNMKAR